MPTPSPAHSVSSTRCSKAEGTAKASATETEELNTEHYPETIPCPLLVIDALGVTNWGCPLYSQEMELMEEQQLAELL